MITCRNCGARNSNGRETCRQCGAALLDIRGIIETDRKVYGGLLWGIGGAVIGGIAFASIYVFWAISRFPTHAVLDGMLSAAFAGGILGGLAGFLIGILARHQ